MVRDLLCIQSAQLSSSVFSEFVIWKALKTIALCESEKWKIADLEIMEGRNDNINQLVKTFYKFCLQEIIFQFSNKHKICA